MYFKSSWYCFKFITYAFHMVGGVKYCPTLDNDPNLEQLHYIEMSLDQTVDPCDDFYSYACNNWAEHHKDTKYKEITGLMDYQMNWQLINLINSAYQYDLPVDDQCQNFVEKTRTYYKACIAEKARNITRYFDEIKPGPGLEWPAMEELRAFQRGQTSYVRPAWTDGQFNVFALLGQLHSYGLNNVLINQEIATTKNGSLQIILESPHVSEQEEIPPTVFMVLLMGWGLPEETAKKYAMKLIRIQKHWHGKYQNFSNNYEAKSAKLTYLQLQQSYPELFDFLENIIPDTIQNTDFVVIHNLDYFQYLLHKSWDSEKAENISNYLMLKFLVHLIKDTTNDFTPYDCIIDLRNKMELSLNYLYHEHIYKKHDVQYETDLNHLLRQILTYYLETLEENPLNLSPEQLLQLQQKLNTISVNVGNLPVHFNISQINEFYRNVPPLDPKNYYKNHLHLLRHRFLKSLLYRQNQTFFIAPDNRVGSSSAPIYITKQHMVILHLGLLQAPVYTFAYDPLLKWSMLGFLLAHEYTHAIDSSGLQYGADGFLLTSDTGILEHANFTAAYECLQNQEATDAIDERVADVVGARVAYNAYIKAYNWKPQPEFSKISWKKLFFLNLAQFFCGRKNVEFEDHDDDAVRLQQIVQNLEAFSDAFQCRLGSKMNPVKKCRVY